MSSLRQLISFIDLLMKSIYAKKIARLYLKKKKKSVSRRMRKKKNGVTERWSSLNSEKYFAPTFI